MNNRQDIFPGFIIGGAPKCGTSSLYNWLNDHPELYGSQPKETFFLMDDDNPLINKTNNFHKDGLSGYSHFFPDKSKLTLILFEATTHYLYQKTALQVINALPQKPKMIFMLRHPSFRIYSSYEYSKNNLVGFKKDLSFSDYTDILLTGNFSKLNQYIEREKSLYTLKNDLEYSTYIHFLEKWKNAVGLDNIRIYLFENMISEPNETMRQITDFLGIDRKFYDNYKFEKKNITFEIKNKKIHKISKQISSLFPKGSFKNVLKKLYLTIQEGKNKTENSEKEAINKLDDYFKLHNTQLSSSFNIDLQKWAH